MRVPDAQGINVFKGGHHFIRPPYSERSSWHGTKRGGVVFSQPELAQRPSSHQAFLSEVAHNDQQWQNPILNKSTFTPQHGSRGEKNLHFILDLFFFFFIRLTPVAHKTGKMNPSPVSASAYAIQGDEMGSEASMFTARWVGQAPVCCLVFHDLNLGLQKAVEGNRPHLNRPLLPFQHLSHPKSLFDS